MNGGMGPSGSGTMVTLGPLFKTKQQTTVKALFSSTFDYVFMLTIGARVFKNKVQLVAKYERL